jgi:hypothetical protein
MTANTNSAIGRFGRVIYQTIFPERLRSRLHEVPAYQGIRESVLAEPTTTPYVSLQARHVANLKVTHSRDAFLDCLPKRGKVAEIGVASGDFSRRIIDITQPTQLHLIDVWHTSRYHSGLQSVVESKMKSEINRGSVSIHRGYSTRVLPQFDDNYFDWVYIDTDHTYATTRAELELSAAKVKPGGIIAGHDFVTGDWRKRNRYGVVEAVHEFCVNNDWEMVLMTHETHRHLSFAIRQLLAK